MLVRSACAVALPLAVALLTRTSPAGAQAEPGPEAPGPTLPPGGSLAPTADRPAVTSPAATEPAPVKLLWRDTWLIWDNAVTTQTVGIGKNYLSADPMYCLLYTSPSPRD